MCILYITWYFTKRFFFYLKTLFFNIIIQVYKALQRFVNMFKHCYIQRMYLCDIKQRKKEEFTIYLLPVALPLYSKH